MGFDKIKSGIKSMSPDITRIDNESYFEVVVKKESLAGVEKLLEEVIGKAVWPSKAKLSKEIQGITDKFGGLRNGQTLFFSDNGESLLFVMLWPWQDGKHVTIKCGRQ
jgi:hypothetical protein